MIRSQKILLTLSIIWLLVILLMGAWWLYLMNYLGQQLVHAGGKVPDLIRLTKWEGSTFIILILLVSSTIYYYYFRIIKKNQAMQAFFASLTHELKTPLASIKLQGEVIKEIAESTNHSKLIELCQRLNQDTNSLENQMDKVLQLSQLEKGFKVNNQELNISKFIKNYHSKLTFDFDLKITDNKNDVQVQADPFALDLIFRNLIENTIRHSNKKEAKLNINCQNSTCQITYSDEGIFKGKQEEIAQLFAKGEHSKGSGIGLYLIKSLTQAMGGKVSFKFNPIYSIIIEFPYSEEAQ